MVMFLAQHPMKSMSLNLFVSLENLATFLTSTLAIICLVFLSLSHIRCGTWFYWFLIFVAFLTFLNQGYRCPKLRKNFLNCIDNTMIWYLISKLGLNLSCAKDFRNLSCMVIWCISWRRLLALIIYQRGILKSFLIKKQIGYNINVLQWTACLVVNPITVGNFAFLFNCTPVGRTSDSKTVLT